MPKSRQLAVIMFTDLAGYSTLMEENENEALSLLRKNKQIHTKCLKQFNGKWLKEMGDGILASFRTISDAVYCAGMILKDVENDEKLNLRIGIHLGEVEVDGNEIYGEGVNTASRIEGIAENNQMLVSEPVYKNIKNKEGISTNFVGEHKLKNISDPVKVYSVNVLDYPRLASTRLPRSNTVILVSSILILIVLSALYLIFIKSEPEEIEPIRIKPLTTSAATLQFYPTFSPDGSLLAYSKYDNPNVDIILTSRESHNERNITNSPYDEIIPRYSPDGLKIAYLYVTESGVDLYWISPSGGKPKFITSTGLHMLEQAGEVFFALGSMPWSPNSKRILYSRLNETGGISIWEVDLNTGDKTQITHPGPGTVDLAASYNKSGSEIVFLRQFKVWIIDEEGNEKPMINEPGIVYLVPSFTSTGDIIFSSNQNGNQNIWKIERPAGKLEQITNVNESALAPVISPQKKIVYTGAEHQTDLISLDLEINQSRQLTSYLGDNFHPAVAPDGNKIAYQSNRTGNNEIWVHNRETGHEILITNNPSDDINPDWSPDGTKIAFLSNRDGQYGLWIADTTGTPPVKLSTGTIELASFTFDYAMELSWSPDGKKIGYIAKSEDGRSIWTVDADGSDMKMQIGGIHSFDWYMDSNTIVYNKIHRSESENPGLRIRNLNTGEDYLLYAGRLTEIFVKQDGSAIGYAYDISHYNQSIYILPVTRDEKNSSILKIGDPVRLTNGKGLWHVHMAAWAPDGKSIVYIRDTDKSNIFELTNRAF